MRAKLKLKLSSYGAIRPEAWARIVAEIKERRLKTDESFIREVGAIAYVGDGLLKEYDAHLRIKPAIINFIPAGNFLITTQHNQSRYLKAIGPTTVIYLNFDVLISLFTAHQELYSVYHGVTNNYEDGLSFRQLLLEEHTTVEKINLFVKKYRPILSDLKKKDIANYIHTDYDHFVRKFGKLL